MKNILILTDFSDRAQNAANYAAHLAGALNANLILCHALEVKEQLTYPLADHLTMQNETMKQLKVVAEGLHDLVLRAVGEQKACPAISLINDLDVLTDVVEKIVDERLDHC